MRTTRRLAAAAAIGALALSTMAAEGDGAVAPTVEATGTRAGGVVTVSGTATPGSGIGAESIEGFLTSFAEANVGNAGGINLQDAFIEQTDEGLVFTWKVESLAAPAAPEVVRYTWSFAVGEATFQLQAKSTNVASVTLADDPAGHVTHAGSSFQVRGNCVAEYMGTPVSNCPHIGWTDGAFNTADGTITMTIPFDFDERIQPGAVILENQTASASVAANYQAVASNNTTGSYINDWKQPYSVGLVVWGVAFPSDADPTKVKGGKPLTLNADGTFSGEIEVEDDETAFVRACTGFTCTVIPVA